MSDSLSKKTKFNNGDKPLVMAWIGRDEPERGDSKSAAGLARTCAEMLDGNYIYVDGLMLEECFPITERLKAAATLGERNQIHVMQVTHFLDLHGHPDLVIGSRGMETHTGHKNPLLVETRYSETLSSHFKCGNLVAHDLTHEELKAKAQEFHEAFPVIKGPLLAVMLGGDPLCAQTAEKLLKVAEQYDEITLFLCPSRRTKWAYKDLKDYLDTKTEGKPHIHIVGMDYKDMLAGYNPYKGLLGAADHIAVIGQSYSLVSEALFTGKTIYTDNSLSKYKKLIWQGRIKPIQDLKEAPFPTVVKNPIDVTTKFASKLVKEFTANAESKAREDQGCGPVAAAIKEGILWLKSLNLNL